jgi:hypothetical protein
MYVTSKVKLSMSGQVPMLSKTVLGHPAVTEVTRVPALDMNLQIFLAQMVDLSSRKQRMQVIVERLLIGHLTYFQTCVTTDHKEHKHSHEQSKRSDVVNIGIIQTNPGSTKGSLAVLDILHKYAPFPNGPGLAPFALPVHGDAASVLGMLCAKRGRAGSKTPSERLEAIWPVPGEFHRRMIQMQDTFNLLYAAGSTHDRGTLANIQTVFKLKGVKSRVSQSFNHDEDMIHMTTKGLVCLVAMSLLHIQETEENARTSDADLQRELHDVAQQIVDFFWHQPSMTDVMACIEADVLEKEDHFCLCDRSLGNYNQI